MHSRIFQLSTTPILKCDYIDASDFDEHWFTNEIADYVAGCDRVNAISWLTACLAGGEIKLDAHGYYLVIHDKEKYFASVYEEFMKSVRAVQNCTLTQFANGEFSHHVWRIKNCHDERFGFYAEFDGLMTFAQFVRMAEIGAKYYIGNALDYHS